MHKFWLYIATSFGNIPRSGRGHSMLNFSSSLWVTARLFSKGSLPSDLPASTYLLTVACLCLCGILAILLSWKQAPHCGFYLHFPMANDVSCLSVCSLRIYISSLRNVHLDSLPVLIGLFVVLLLNCKSSLDILDASSLSGRWFANVFS